MANSIGIAYRTAMIATFLLLVSSVAVLAQGGGSGGTQATGEAGSGGGGTAGGTLSGAEPAGSKPAGKSETPSGKQPGATVRIDGTDRQSEVGAAGIKAKSPAREFDSWLASSKEGARLGSIYERLRESAAPALDAGVPLEAFKARIREAAAKGASPDIVATAMEADAARWIWLAELVRDRAWPPVKTAAGFYLSAASALRNGLGEAAVRDLVIWSAASSITSERAGAALTAAVSLSAALGMRGGQSDSAAVLFASSKLRIGQYDSVAVLANRALAAGISAERFMTILEATMREGRTLADLEKALSL